MPLRFFGLAPFASGITLSLFWLMTLLIATSDTAPAPVQRKQIQWVKVRTTTPVETTRPKKPARPNPPIAPKQPTTDLDPAVPTLPGLRRRIRNENGEGRSEHRLTRLSKDSADASPLVRIPPRYPRQALQRGIEGRVLVEFTINGTGGVEDAHVIRAEPPGVFDQEALRAVEQWRYAPKVIEGKAVVREGMRIAIPFRKGGRPSS